MHQRDKVLNELIDKILFQTSTKIVKMRTQIIIHLFVICFISISKTWGQGKDGFNKEIIKSNRESKGQKLFWSRGNGWVMGLVKLLQEMPKNYAGRDFYLKLYKEMANSLLSLQQADGLWLSLIHI